MGTRSRVNRKSSLSDSDQARLNLGSFTEFALAVKVDFTIETFGPEDAQDKHLSPSKLYSGLCMG